MATHRKLAAFCATAITTATLIAAPAANAAITVEVQKKDSAYICKPSGFSAAAVRGGYEKLLESNKKLAAALKTAAKAYVTAKGVTGLTDDEKYFATSESEPAARFTYGLALAAIKTDGTKLESDINGQWSIPPLIDLRLLAVTLSNNEANIALQGDVNAAIADELTNRLHDEKTTPFRDAIAADPAVKAAAQAYLADLKAVEAETNGVARICTTEGEALLRKSPFAGSFGSS